MHPPRHAGRGFVGGEASFKTASGVDAHHVSPMPNRLLSRVSDNDKLAGHVRRRRFVVDARPAEQSGRLLIHRDEWVVTCVRENVVLGFKERQASV